MKGISTMNNKHKDLFGELSKTEKKQAKLRGMISAAIANERHAQNLSQKDFADMLGVTQGMISKLESSEYNMTLDKFVELLDKLDMEYEISINGKEIVTNQSIFYGNIPYKHNCFEDFNFSPPYSKKWITKINLLGASA